jgi:large subunit ribosomal protein L24
VQTTLLGLAVALILALLAALVGPYFVNWDDHRAFFEAEASRLVGLDVRVAGPIKVSVLPSPSMTLGDIEIGPAGQTSRLRARSLSIELALGPLMRGEIRAVETRLVGPQFNVGLNSLGQVDWPSMTPQTETVAIERLSIEDGRAVLTDAASNSRVVLDKLWFRGQVRSLAGPFRGEGAFVSSSEIFGYRISAGRLGDEGIRVKLNVDIAERPLVIEAEGLLAPDRAAPRFEGSLSMSRPAGSVKASGRTVAHEPWKLSGKVKADAQSALLEQVEFQYGPEERAAKLDGAAEIKFGERPRLQGALSARQIDLDRLIATPSAPRRLPAAATQAFAELFSGMMRPSIPVSLTVSIDAVTLGGAVLQGFASDLRSDGAAWRLDKLDFRAPGFTKVSISGRLDLTAKGIGFAGATSVDANDPKALIAWLAGHPVAPGQASIRPWQVRGDVTLAADRIAIEQLRTEFDRRIIEGRLAYVWPVAGRPARLDAELRAAEIDFDAVLSFADGAFSGIGLEPPRDIALALQVGKARIAGFEARNSTARVKLDADGILIERLSVADFGDATIEASGRIVTSPSPGGRIAVDLDARKLDAIIAAAEKFAPMLADPLRSVASREKTAKLHGTVSLENAAGGSAAAKLALAGRLGSVRVDLTAEAVGKPEHFVVTDLGALAATNARFDGRFEADKGGELLAFVGLDRLADIDRLAAGSRPALLTVSTTGPLNRELRFDGRLAAGAIDASGKGTLRIPADAPAVISLDQVAGTVAGATVQGRLVFHAGAAPRLDGAIETESLDAAALVAAAVGMNAKGGEPAASEPFVLSASDLSGRIEFRALRASLSSALQARQMRGAIRFSPSEVVFEDIEAELAKGRLGGRIAFATGADGVSARARVTLSGADAAAVIAGDNRRSPVTGRLTFQAELEGAGRSPAAFVGSLAGTAKVTLENAQLAGLNPRVFDAVIRAVELGIPTDTHRIRDFVVTALENGTLPAARAEAAITVAAGQARLSNVVTRTSGADLAVATSVDLADATLDATLTLTGTQVQGGGLHPTISIALKGPLLSPTRTVDASALASWLALRAVEQQSRQLDTMERLQREANVPPAETAKPSTAPSADIVVPASEGEATGLLEVRAPPLPPAINVLPIPKPRTPRAAPPVRAAAPKPPAPPVNPPLDLFGAQR